MKLVVKYGTILAIASICWTLIEILIANVFKFFAISTLTSLLALFIPMVVLIIALREHKKHTPFFEVRDALSAGTLIAIIGATGFSLFLFILYSAFPQVINPYLDYLREQLTIAQTPSEEINQTIDLIKSQFSPISQAVYAFISMILTSFVLSWIIGKVLRTKIKHTEISATPE